MKKMVVVATFLVSLLCSSLLLADPIAPSLLEVTRRSATAIEMIWRTPIKPVQSNNGALQLRVSSGCSRVSHLTEFEGQFIEETFTLMCPEDSSFVLPIENLLSPSANVLARYFIDDTLIASQILTPENPIFDEAELAAKRSHAGQFFGFGVTHLLSGVDHVLYLICLVLLSGLTRDLLVTITLFTLAHSITLASAMMGVISLPAMFVESMIAFSIVYSAGWLFQSKRSLSNKKLWISVFCFGLLHGFGFSSVLNDIGLPADDLPMSLFLFNIGIEVGQLIIVLVLLGLTWLIKRLPQYNSERQYLFNQYLAVAVGVVAAHWFWQRLLSS